MVIFFLIEHETTPYSRNNEASALNNAPSSSNSGSKNEGEISAASKDSKSSSDFWK